MYEICQNEFRLGVTGDRHFSSGDEYDLDVKYRCIIASSSRAPIYPIRAENGLYSRDLFNDNYFYHFHPCSKFATIDRLESRVRIFL